MSDQPLPLAKLTWTHPETGVQQEFTLAEGATVTIGRSANNDIHIPEQHVSRQHAVITYRDGVFMITDMGSANGTFVNDQQITEPFPLFSNDVIRLYVPTLVFSAADENAQQKTDREIVKPQPQQKTGQCNLIVTNGPQEGQVIPLLVKEITIGRATTRATWEVALQDPSVSRPHARLERINDSWLLKDLGSSNGTLVNGVAISDKGRVLRDGDVIALGASMLLFRDE